MIRRRACSYSSVGTPPPEVLCSASVGLGPMVLIRVALAPAALAAVASGDCAKTRAISKDAFLFASNPK